MLDKTAVICYNHEQLEEYLEPIEDKKMDRFLMLMTLWISMSGVVAGQELHSVGRGGYVVTNDPRPPLTLENYKPNVGDIILWQSADALTREFFWRATGSEITHANIIVPHPKDGRMMVLDVNRGKKTELLEVREYLKQEGIIVVRKCNKKLSEKERGAIVEFVKDQLGKPYANAKDLSLVYRSIPLIPEVLDKVSDGELKRWRETITGKNRRWFCSQLVVATAQAGGLIDRKINPSAVIPEDLFHANNPNWDTPQRLWRK